MRANFAEVYLRGMLDRSMRSGTELAWEILLTAVETLLSLSAAIKLLGIKGIFSRTNVVSFMA